MANNQNRQQPRPKPSVGTGQQKVPTAVEPELTRVEDIPEVRSAAVPDVAVAAEITAIADADIPVAASPIVQADTVIAPNKDELIATLVADLADAKSRLEDIRVVINNPFHMVGYLVNKAPVQKILDRPRTSE